MTRLFGTSVSESWVCGGGCRGDPKPIVQVEDSDTSEGKRSPETRVTRGGCFERGPGDVHGKCHGPCEEGVNGGRTGRSESGRWRSETV